MAHGRRLAQWDKLASLFCFVHNAFAKEKDIKTPDDFNPYSEKNKKKKSTAAKSAPAQKTMFNTLKSVFFDENNNYKLKRR